LLVSATSGKPKAGFGIGMPGQSQESWWR